MRTVQYGKAVLYVFPATPRRELYSTYKMGYRYTSHTHTRTRKLGVSLGDPWLDSPPHFCLFQPVQYIVLYSPTPPFLKKKNSEHYIAREA